MVSSTSQIPSWRHDFPAGVIAYFTAAPSILICYFLLIPLFQNQHQMISHLCLWSGIITIIGSIWYRIPLIMLPNISVVSLLVFFLYWGEAWSTSQILLAFILVSLLLLLAGFLHIGQIIETRLPPFYPAALLVGLGFLLVTTGLRLGGFIVSHPISFTVLGVMTTRSAVIVLIGLFLFLVAWSRSYSVPVIWGLCGALVMSILLNTFHLDSDLSSQFSEDFNLTIPDYDLMSLEMLSSLPGLCFIVLFETILIGMAIRYLYPQSYSLDRLFKLCGIGGILSGVSGVPGPLPVPEGLGALIYQNSSWRAGLITGCLLILSALFIPLLSVPGVNILVGPEARVYPIGATMTILLGIGCMKALKGIDWHQKDQTLVVMTMCIMVPLTQSIINGFGISLIVYLSYHILQGHAGRIHPSLYLMVILFLIKLSY